jgi:hypothetical protein
VQIFQGVVIRRQGSGLRETFTVRKLSFGVGVERTYPLHSPALDRIEVVSKGDVRRAKLYYLRRPSWQEGEDQGNCARPRPLNRRSRKNLGTRRVPIFFHVVLGWPPTLNRVNSGRAAWPSFQATGPTTATLSPVNNGPRREHKQTGQGARACPLWQELPLLLVVAFCLAVLIPHILMQAFYIPSGLDGRTLCSSATRVLVNKGRYTNSAIPERGRGHRLQRAGKLDRD